MFKFNQTLFLLLFIWISIPMATNQLNYAETVTNVDSVFTQTTRRKDFLLGAGFFTTNGGDPNLKITKQGMILQPTVTVSLRSYFTFFR